MCCVMFLSTNEDRGIVLLSHFKGVIAGLDLSSWVGAEREGLLRACYARTTSSIAVLRLVISTHT